MSSNLPINKQIEKYIDEHSLKLHPVQDEIIKHNDTLGKKKKLQISINQCHFLYLVTKLFKPKEILEIGTFTGLSSLSMCIGLENDSKITTIDKNKDTSLVAKNFFEKAKVSEKINIIIDEAINGINKLISQKKLFDLIFIDADKENYKKYNLVIGMYHDQVLTPLKTLYNFNAINITIGLPFIRVSPDHGPNISMYGKNKSDPSSIFCAMDFFNKI